MGIQSSFPFLSSHSRLPARTHTSAIASRLDSFNDPRIRKSFMSRTHQPSFSYSSQSTLASSRTKEHPSIGVPPPEPDPSFERSRFSPDSPTERRFSFGRPIFSYKSSQRKRPLDLEKGSAGNSTANSPQDAQPSFRERFARLLVILRPSRTRDDDPSAQRAAPIVASSSDLPAWRPLDVRKQGGIQCDCHFQSAQQTRQQKWYRRAQRSALAVFLLYLFINVVILDVHLYKLANWWPQAHSTNSSASAPSPSSPPTTTIMLSPDTQQCITQYTLNAPGNPTGYPCSMCLPLLAAVPPNATAVYPIARDATQFCGLRSIWEDANQQGQAGLEAGGWVKDIKFCTWSGVRCDGGGHVSSLQLTFPAVPASIPEQSTNLTSLESLEIIGNGNSPAGSFPTGFDALTKLTSLHLENTALGALPNTLKTLTSLTLVRNAQIGSSLPPSIGGGPLRSLIVNNEQLTLSSAQSAALCGGQLQTCDLRGSGIKACGACLVG